MVGLTFRRRKKTTVVDPKDPATNGTVQSNTASPNKPVTTHGSVSPPSSPTPTVPNGQHAHSNTTSPRSLPTSTQRPQSATPTLVTRRTRLAISTGPDSRRSWNLGKPSVNPNTANSPIQDLDIHRPTIRIQFRGKIRATGEVWSGSQASEIPNFPLAPPAGSVYSAVTGPDEGLLMIKETSLSDNNSEPRASASTLTPSFWSRFSSRKCDGISQSLYDKHPFTGNITGDPNADAFLCVSRSNCTLMAIADGVNWGEHSRVAARAALLGVWHELQPVLFPEDCFHNLLEGLPQTQLTDPLQTNGRGKKANGGQSHHKLRPNHLTPLITDKVEPNVNIDKLPTLSPPKDTQGALDLLYRALWSAQDCVLRHTHIGFTTLCLSLILPLAPPSRQFAACCVNVGDSLAFLLSRYHGVREITAASHEGADEVRNLRNAGGALGAVHVGEEEAAATPALHNLTFALTLSDAGDLLFLTSDGISDNFDPVVMRWAAQECSDIRFIDEDTEDEDAIDEKKEKIHVNGKVTPGLRCSPQRSVSDVSAYLSRYRENTAPATPSRQNSVQPSNSNPPVLNGDTLRATDVCFIDQLQLSGHERRQYGMKEMERLWHEEEIRLDAPASAREFCQSLQREVLHRTQGRRDVLEDRRLYRGKLNLQERQTQHALVQQKLRLLPGKLDHATVVACEVGLYKGDDFEDYEATTPLLPSPAPTPTSEMQPPFFQETLVTKL